MRTIGSMSHIKIYLFLSNHSLALLINIYISLSHCYREETNKKHHKHFSIYFSLSPRQFICLFFFPYISTRVHFSLFPSSVDQDLRINSIFAPLYVCVCTCGYCCWLPRHRWLDKYRLPVLTTCRRRDTQSV